MTDEREQLIGVIDALFLASLDALIVSDAAGRVIRLNAAATDLLGGGAEDGQAGDRWIGGVVLLTPAGERVAASGHPTRRALSGETVRGEPLSLETATGRRLSVLVGAAPVRAVDGRIVGAVTTLADVTKLHDVQEEREEYAHSISHDLRGPLTVILGQAQLIQRTADRVELVRRGADAVATSARRMNVMIQDLVDSARLDSGHLRLNPLAVDLPSVAASLRERFVSSAADQRVVVEPAPALPPALVDPVRLERILGTLVSNALKYSRPPAAVRISFRREGGSVVTAVSDEGRGILPEDQAHLFERYFRGHNVDEAREGLGLGLYIAKGLIEAQGGRIWFESTPGRGTTFWFALPAAEQSAAANRQTPDTTPKKPHAA